MSLIARLEFTLSKPEGPLGPWARQLRVELETEHGVLHNTSEIIQDDFVGGIDYLFASSLKALKALEQERKE